MNCDVTLTADEFKTIHNALWTLQYGNGDVKEQVEIIRAALSNAYDQERDASDRKYDHYQQVKKELGLDAIWSVYEVDNLSERHPFQGATKVVYSAFGSGDQEVAINGSTWAALYVAGNALIRDSGDNHHVFIEHFKQSSVNPEILFMTTGS
jgi:hypothetical protein